MQVNPAEFREVLGRFATGVTVVTTVANGRPIGLTANAFTSVSLDPPLVLFCLDRDFSDLDAFVQGECFAINILADDQKDHSVRFSTSGADRFAELDFETWETGSPILPGAVASIDCQRHAVHDGGDHAIVIGRVLRADLVTSDSAPLVFHRGAYCDIA